MPIDRGLLDPEATPLWYAVCTRSNHERRVAEQLAERGVENFLPQYDSVRRWKDRKVHLKMPLFPGYVFVHLALQNRVSVLQVPGVARLVGFAGRPSPVPEEEFARIRGFLKQGFARRTHTYLKRQGGVFGCGAVSGGWREPFCGHGRIAAAWSSRPRADPAGDGRGR